MKYTIHGNDIIHENGSSVHFEFPIKELVDVEGILVVVLAIPPKIIYQNNGFAVKDGKLLWQVESDPRIPPSARNLYIGVAAEKGELFFVNYLGYIDVVDINTGKIIRSYESK